MDEQREPTIEEKLITSLATKNGILSAQNEYLQLQLDQAQQLIATLQPQTNNEHEGALVQ